MSTYPTTGTTCPHCEGPLFYSEGERVVYCAYGAECEYERPYREGESYAHLPLGFAQVPPAKRTVADAVRVARGLTGPPSIPVQFKTAAAALLLFAASGALAQTPQTATPEAAPPEASCSPSLSVLVSDCAARQCRAAWAETAVTSAALARWQTAADSLARAASGAERAAQAADRAHAEAMRQMQTALDACDERVQIREDQLDARQRPPLRIALGPSYSPHGIGVAAGLTGTLPLPLLPDVGVVLGGSLPLAAPSRPSGFLLLHLR